MNKTLETLIDQLNKEITEREQFIAETEAKRSKAEADLTAITSNSTKAGGLEDYKTAVHAINDKKAEIEFYNLQIASKKPTSDGAEEKLNIILAEYNAGKADLIGTLKKHCEAMEKAIEEANQTTADARTALTLIRQFHGVDYSNHALSDYSFKTPVIGALYRSSKTLIQEDEKR